MGSWKWMNTARKKVSHLLQLLLVTIMVHNLIYKCVTVIGWVNPAVVEKFGLAKSEEELKGN